MSYRIAVKRSAAKAIKKIPKADRKRIIEKIDSLSENLPNPDATKMKGNNPFHKVRTGDYRIIYEIQEDVLVESAGKSRQGVGGESPPHGKE